MVMNKRRNKIVEIEIMTYKNVRIFREIENYPVSWIHEI